jgi:hypothetical protein
MLRFSNFIFNLWTFYPPGFQQVHFCTLLNSRSFYSIFHSFSHPSVEDSNYWKFSNKI